MGVWFRGIISHLQCLFGNEIWDGPGFDSQCVQFLFLLLCCSCRRARGCTRLLCNRSTVGKVPIGKKKFFSFLRLYFRYYSTSAYEVWAGRNRVELAVFQISAWGTPHICTVEMIGEHVTQATPYLVLYTTLKRKWPKIPEWSFLLQPALTIQYTLTREQNLKFIP